MKEKTIEEQYTLIEVYKKDQLSLEDKIEQAEELLIQKLSDEMEIGVGDKVKLAIGRVVVIHSFFVSYSQNHMMGMRYKNKISKDEYKELTRRSYALHAKCYETTKSGKISKRESPKYNSHCLEGCVHIRD